MNILNVAIGVVSFVDPTGIFQIVSVLRAGVKLIEDIQKGAERQEELNKLWHSLQKVYNALGDKRQKPGPKLRKAIEEAKKAIEMSKWDIAARLLGDAGELLDGVSSIPC